MNKSGMHDINNCDENHGVRMEIRLEDWFAGVNSLIPYEIRNPSGYWLEYSPPGEWQRDDDTDTFGCVSYSDNNDVEMQLNQYLYQGKLSDYKIQRSIDLKWLKSKTGMVINFEAVKNNPRNFSYDFSDRWLAKMSGTTPEGNWLWKVGDIYRKQGIVGEPRWQTPYNYTWDSYYASIPQDIQNEGMEFLKLFDVAYEFLTVTRENLIKHLQHVPLQIVIPGHAIVGIKTTQNIVEYFDSYDPFVKQLVGLPQVAMKLVITLKPDDMPMEFLRTFRIEGDVDHKVFAVLNGKRFWIAPFSIYQDGRGKLWADVNPADTAIIKPEEAAKYPIAGLFGNASILDYVKFLFIK